MMANTRSGSAVITVLVLITVLLTIAGGLAYLHRVNGRLARNYLDEAQAMYLAEAGLAVAETVLRQDPNHRLPVTGELNTGTYRVEFRTHGEQLQQQRLSLPVEATGRAGAARQTLVELFTLEPYPRHETYDYVLFHGTDQANLILLEGSHIDGHVFANGDISILSELTMRGTLYASGTVLSEQEEDLDTVTGVNPIDFPDLDADFYRSIAVITITGPAHVSGSENSGGVVFVFGDVVVTGNLTPGTAVIATGKLTISAGSTATGMVLLIGKEGIEVESCSLTAVLFSPATVAFQTPATLTGTVTAKRVICHSGVRLCYLDPAKQELQAPLPGLTVTRSNWYQKFFIPVAD